MFMKLVFQAIGIAWPLFLNIYGHSMCLQHENNVINSHILCGCLKHGWVDSTTHFTISHTHFIIHYEKKPSWIKRYVQDLMNQTYISVYRFIWCFLINPPQWYYCIRNPPWIISNTTFISHLHEKYEVDLCQMLQNGHCYRAIGFIEQAALGPCV